jgi:hypothetical protein
MTAEAGMMGSRSKGGKKKGGKGGAKKGSHISMQSAQQTMGGMAGMYAGLE